MELNVAMAGGVGAGYFLDKIFNTFPWFTGIFFIGGVGAGINIAVVIVRKYKKFLST